MGRVWNGRAAGLGLGTAPCAGWAEQQPLALWRAACVVRIAGSWDTQQGEVSTSCSNSSGDKSRQQLFCAASEVLITLKLYCNHKKTAMLDKATPIELRLSIHERRRKWR